MRIDFSLISYGIDLMMISLLEFLIDARRATFDKTFPSRLDESSRLTISGSTVIRPGPTLGSRSKFPKTLILGFGLSGKKFVNNSDFRLTYFGFLPLTSIDSLCRIKIKKKLQSSGALNKFVTVKHFRGIPSMINPLLAVPVIEIPARKYLGFVFQLQIRNFLNDLKLLIDVPQNLRINYMVKNSILDIRAYILLIFNIERDSIVLLELFSVLHHKHDLLCPDIFQILSRVIFQGQMSSPPFLNILNISTILQKSGPHPQNLNNVRKKSSGNFHSLAIG